MAIFRFPIMKRLLINLSGAAHIYETGTRTTSNYYVDAATSYHFRSGLYLNDSYRHYFDSDLESVELFTELGWRW